MRVRLQMGQGRARDQHRPKNQRLAAAAAVLLAPFTLLTALFAIWRLAADMSLASNFLFDSGALSHWAVWGALAVALAFVTSRLNRYGEPDTPPAEVGDAAASRGAQ